VDSRDPANLARAKEASAFLRTFWNEDNWDFATNGEELVLRSFARWHADQAGGPVEVWDVGAHAGEWAEAAHALLPEAQVTSFELVPELAADLVVQTADRPWHTAVASGLSDAEGTVAVSVTTSTTTAIEPRVGTKFYRESDPVVECPITTGDAHLARTGATPPTLLKIDTEGHEAAVLRGCHGLLGRADGPALIQLEYGDTWIPAGASLFRVQRELEALGYAVGRLFPDHVAFKTWERGDDHFRMGNMVAVRDDALRALLAG
jgi:FkbM family methyltransferase